jgi:hypothetical protein
LFCLGSDKATGERKVILFFSMHEDIVKTGKSGGAPYQVSLVLFPSLAKYNDD